jgi:hypothetical protein
MLSGRSRTGLKSLISFAIAKEQMIKLPGKAKIKKKQGQKVVHKNVS